MRLEKAKSRGHPSPACEMASFCRVRSTYVADVTHAPLGFHGGFVVKANLDRLSRESLSLGLLFWVADGGKV